MEENDENNQQMKRKWKKIRHNVYQMTIGSNITKPTMVFSVIGDSNSSVPRPWQTIVFQKALIEAAKNGGETWILYRGKKTVVSKVVEEAYHHYEKIELLNQSAELFDPRRHIKLIDLSERFGDYEDDEWSGLNVVDDSSNSSYNPTKYELNDGEYNNLEMEFEKFVSEQKVFLFGRNINIKIPVPVAIIVCEGDLKTIAAISHAVKKNLPVIIIKGSGKAADFTVDYLENSEVLWKKACISFGIKLDAEKYNELKQYLKDIKKHEKLVSVFDLDQEDPLLFSSIVGDALIRCMLMTKTFQKNKRRGKHGNSRSVFDDFKDDTTIQESFKSRLFWIPRTYVSRGKDCTPTSLPLHFFFGYQIWQDNKLEKDEIGHVLLFEALKANRCDYVKVLLDRNVVLDDHYLDELYLQTVLCTECGVQSLNCSHIKWDLKKIPQANMLYAKIRKMYDDRKCQRTKSDKEEIEACDDEAIMKDTVKQMCLDILRYDKFEHFWSEFCEDFSAAGILLWAIFLNRKDLAEICWRNVKNRLLAGLICSAILKKLSKSADDVKEHVIAKDLEDHSIEFEKRCISLMDQLFEENETLAIDALTTKTNIWGIRSNPLIFAYENFMYDTIAHPCSQKYMNDRWWKNLDPDMESFLKSSIWNHLRKTVQAPETKYIINYVVFFLVLMAYSIFVLTNVGGKYPTPTTKALEIFVYIWNVGDAIEEFVACTGCKNKQEGSHRGVISRIERHLNDFWNVVDLLSYFLIIVALFVRHFYQNDSHTIARNLFALSLLVMYLRFLEVFLVHKQLGPTLMMIKEMLKDLLVFLLIAFFVILGVGIYYHANLWPDHQTMWNNGFSNWSIWKIIYFPYWQLYGEFNLEILYGVDHSDCNVTSIWESDMSMNRCPHEDWTVPVVAAIFVLFSNLLLVNLVIAMFSYTFERVMKIAKKVWHFQRYTVIIDYNHRIPSPFNLILRPIIWICSPKCSGCSCRVHASTSD